MKNIKEYASLLESYDLITESHIEDYKDVKYISCDSSDIKEDSMFICKGENFKKEYLEESLKKGAFCYVSEKKYIDNSSYMIVKDIRLAMSLLSEFYHDSCWNRHLNMIGITGTKGKSTTACFIKAILDDYEKGKCGFLSGIFTYDGKSINKSPTLTTPETIELHRHLASCVDNHCRYLVMEVSSQGLKYRRTDELNYEIGAFLNSSPDHISDSEHKNFEDYLASKLLLFRQCECAVINMDTDEKYRKEILSEAKKYCQKAFFIIQ